MAAATKSTRLPNVLIVGTGEYTTGWIGGTILQVLRDSLSDTHERVALDGHNQIPQPRVTRNAAWSDSSSSIFGDEGLWER